MHTAICAFPDRAAAARAADRLEAAGFARHDIHIEHRQVQDHVTMEGEGAASRDRPAPNDAWDGLEREVAVDKRVLEKFGRFFSILFGRNEHGHADTYATHLAGGRVVVVVDTDDEAQAQRATQLLHELEASDPTVLHRAQARPLRDIVGARQAEGLERSFGTARGEMPSTVRQDSIEEDRAMAAARAGERPGLVEDREAPGDKPGLRLKNMGRSDGL